VSEVEYRFEYKIQRKRPQDQDFRTVGFGSSGAWGSVEQALHIATSDVQNGGWETSGRMPSPQSVIAEQ
jgi:hypothetical protein